MRWVSLISSGHSIQMQKNTPSSEVHMEHSPGQTTPCVSNQALVNLRKWKLYQASSRPEYYETRHQLQEKKKKTVRNTNKQRLSNLFLNNHQVTEEIKREIRNFQKQMIRKTQQLKTYGMQQKQLLEGILQQCNPTSKNKTSNGQPTFTPKTTGKRRTKIPQNQQKERNLKV